MPTTTKTARASERVADEVKADTDYATARVREAGVRTIDASRTFGQLALDAYEETAKGLIEFEQRAGEAAPVDWMKAAIGAHVSFVQDVNAAYLKAARNLLD
jgi:hypothetical protein